FGHASMLSGLPTGFEARAAEDTLCYRIPADVIGPLLARPDFLRFIARSIVGGRTGGGERVPPTDPIQRPVETLIRTPPLVCSADEPIREAAKRMTADRASAILVRSGETLGIVTDYDLRSRVVAAGVSPDTPVSAIMSAPAYTVGAGSLAGDVLLDMLERGVHHVPVLSAAGEVLGVVDGGDLIAAEARKPFLLRRAIDLATSAADLAAASAGLGPMIIALHDARVAAEHVAAIRCVVLDALTRRLIELAVAKAGQPPAPFTWFALGSLARRETVPSSDVDSALAWEDSGDGRAAGDYMARVARAVDEGLRACGLQPDEHGASASNPLFARPLSSWRAAARDLSEDPTREKALILVSVISDSRPLWGSGPGAGTGGAGAGAAGIGGPGASVSVADTLWQARGRPDLLRLLARFALQFRPPTGFLRDFVVEHSGERRGQLDIKHGGMIPIVDLARWAGMAAGAASCSTVDRLRAAEAAGTLGSPDARTLIEAFGFIFALRLDHQVEQLRRGEPPDDFIDPKTLNPLARSYLREAFRAVASVQSGLANELSFGVR
ncbi:MAG TPA: putative nucleotidyltransferase substrate binding domain-containing protein, partial [Streptosporangiaceae bacterium]|nr:putative nucleotidyltransferase substrate binding domain-containing protein [Streptosporangiaceae bacterium]